MSHQTCRKRRTPEAWQVALSLLECKPRLRGRKKRKREVDSHTSTSLIATKKAGEGVGGEKTKIEKGHIEGEGTWTAPVLPRRRRAFNAKEQKTLRLYGFHLSYSRAHGAPGANLRGCVCHPHGATGLSSDWRTQSAFRSCTSSAEVCNFCWTHGRTPTSALT